MTGLCAAACALEDIVIPRIPLRDYLRLSV
jgi:hypothetical protein